MKRTLIALFLLSTFTISIFGWGFSVHRTIVKTAIERLSGPSLNYFLPFESQIMAYSTYPDEHQDFEAGTAHFMEIDFYAEPPFDNLRSKIENYMQTYGEAIGRGHGYAPWAIDKYYHLLVEDIATNSPDVPKIAGILAHFASDINMPLHATVNFEGQMTGQSGIHGLWESAIVDKRFDASMILPTKVSTVTDIIDASLENSKIAWYYAQSLLAIDRSEKTLFGQLSKDPLVSSVSYENMLWDSTKWIATVQITRSVEFVSTLFQMAYNQSKSYVPKAASRPNIVIFKVSSNGNDQYVAIKNAGDKSVNLKGWKISNGEGQYFVFENDLLIDPGRYILVHSGPDAKGLIWSKSLVWSAHGKARLFDPDGNMAFEFVY
ncbi:lamin tail domain-containing protein [Athalassotoga saccharophila]|uniref:lamin tail domain-containing protein n=1 Tax=Athalassotoga saccharophila TaxID=1441386 RepID=UPI00137B46E2|nr:lamin tail domain-containing protein [Athalassotoga saccharophila]BBJ27484.1 S1/P1 Nuclease [Athalassotoga saccharophila]